MEGRIFSVLHFARRFPSSSGACSRAMPQVAGCGSAGRGALMGTWSLLRGIVGCVLCFLDVRSC